MSGNVSDSVSSYGNGGVYEASEAKGAKKIAPNTTRKEVVAMNQAKAVPNGKGTQVHKSENPFYEQTDVEHFDGLKDKGILEADKKTKEVKAELARLYNDVKREHPEVAEDLIFPPLPNVIKKGNKDVRLENYLDALKDWKVTCKELMEDSIRASLSREIKESKEDVIAVVEITGDMIADTVVSMGQENLAATLGVGALVLDGLSEIYSKIDNDTRTILTAIDKQGNKIIRTIDKRTKELKDLVMKEGQMTRDQEFWNSVILDINNAERIDGVHRHIDDDGSWTRNVVRGEHNRTRGTVRGARDEVLDEIDRLPGRIR